MNLIYKDSPQLLQNILALFSHPFTPLPFKIWLLILLLACIFSQAKQDPPIAMQIYFRKDSAHRLMPIIVSITEHNCSTSTSSSSSIKANKLGPHVQCYDSIMQSIVFLSLSLFLFSFVLALAPIWKRSCRCKATPTLSPPLRCSVQCQRSRSAVCRSHATTRPMRKLWYWSRTLIWTQMAPISTSGWRAWTTNSTLYIMYNLLYFPL